MKWQAWGIALLPTALLAPLVLGGTKDEQARGLTRVGDATATGAPRADDPASTGSTSTFDAQAWKTRLAERDLDARERAFDELARTLRTDESARRAVEDWSRDASNTELAWTSRLLLRESRSSVAGRGGIEPRGMLAPRFDDLRSRFDELERHFGGLDSMFEDMQRELDQRFGGGSGLGGSGSGGTGLAPQPGGNAPHGGLSRQAQSYSMQMGPDGVKVEVQEDVDGKQETKTYTAKTLDELYEAHPELRERMNLRMGTKLGGGFARPFWLDPNDPDSKSNDPFGDDAWQPFGNDSRLRQVLPGDGRVPTDRLGVMIDEKASIDRAKLKIDEGVGLSVRSVQDGTIARKIGIETGDVIVDVNGRAIKGVDDVRGVLSSRKIDEDVTVTVIDAQGKRRTLTWRAVGEDKDGKPEEKGRSF